MSTELIELNPDDFEARCCELIRSEYPENEIKRVGRRGSRQYGVDILDKTQNVLFQCKRFKHFEKSQKDQVVRSLKKTEEGIKQGKLQMPTKWILCLPIELDLDEVDWVENQVKKVLGPSIKCEVWGETILSTVARRGIDYRRYLEGTINPTPYPDIWDVLGEKYAPWDKQYISLPLKSATEILDIDDALAKYPNLLITGDLGSGKTTLLQHISMERARNIVDHLPARGQYVDIPRDTAIPIYMRLGDYTFNPQKARSENILRLCKNALRDKGISSEVLEQPGVVEKEFEERKFLFLFDGLNEVSQNLVTRYVEDLTTFQELFREQSHRYVVTTRQVYAEGYKYKLNRFHEVLIESLSRKDIECYLQLYLKDKKSTRQLFSQIVRDKRLRELAQNPLLLGILTHLYKSNPSIRQNLPRCGGKLVGQFIKDILDRAGLVTKNKFSGKLKHEVLISISVEMYGIEEGKSRLEQYKLEQGVIYSAVKRKLRYLREDDIDVSELINELISNHLLVVEDNPKIKFWHLRFQEYFGACAISEIWLNKNYERIEKYIKDPNWYYLFSMMAGVLSAHPYTPYEDPHARAKELYDFVYQRNKLLTAMCISQTDDLPKEVEEGFVNEVKDKILDTERHLRRNIYLFFGLSASVWIMGLLGMIVLTVHLPRGIGMHNIIGILLVSLYCMILPCIFAPKVLRSVIDKNINTVQDRIHPLLLILNQAGLGSPYPREALREIKHKFQSKRPSYLRETADETGRVTDAILGILSKYDKPNPKPEPLKELSNPKYQMYAVQELLILFRAGKLSDSTLDRIIGMLGTKEDFVVAGALIFLKGAFEGESKSLQLTERHEGIAEALRSIMTDPHRSSKIKKLASRTLRRMGGNPLSRQLLLQIIREIFAIIRHLLRSIFALSRK